MSRLARLPIRQHIATIALLLAMAVVRCDEPPVAGSTNASADASNGDALLLPDGAVAKKLALLGVIPNHGNIAGGEQVDISGTGFDASAKVFFGDQQAEVQWRAGFAHIFVTAPATKQPGPIKVTVQNSKTSKAQLLNGYVYLSQVTVDAFEPTVGTMLGSTEITVHGTGFRQGDRVLVGYMEAAQTKFIDDRTLVALTPPYLDASTDVKTDLAKVQVSVRHASGVMHAKPVFSYGRPPRVDSVGPAIVGLDGGPVSLKGSGLGNATQIFANGALGVLAPGSASGSRGASMPALLAINANAQPGAAELVVTSPYGNHKLFPAFAYVEATASTVTLYGASPASGPTGGGNSVVLMAALPDGTEIQSVTIGGKPAPHKQNGATVEVTVPSGAAGTATISVTTSQGTAELTNGYLYVPDLKIDLIDKNLGPMAGGVVAQIRGKGFSPGCTVRIGMYVAKVQEVAAKGNAMDVMTPPGAPGAADVVVRCGTVEVLLPAGYGYMADHARVNAVSPPSGSTGGGAVVKVYGSGLRMGVKILFGGKAVPAATFVHSGLAEVKVPPHEAGKVAVDVLDGEAFDTLVDGFNYYLPGNPEGGTWGEGVGGTLNVTVLNIYTRAPIEDATVQLGSPGDSVYEKYTGVTDAKGMVVFSGPDVVPPIRVSATKPQFTASSIMHFDASNSTLLLFPYTPPSSGSGEPGKGKVPPFALLQGKVVDVDKYLLIPPANCLGSTDSGDLTCKTCDLPSDCSGTAAGNVGFLCINNGAAGKRCLPDCSSKDPCKKGFVCVPDDVEPGAKVCKPTMGIRKVYCATTIRDIDAEGDNPTPSKVGNNGALPYKTSTVDEITGGFAITSRLDELAVVCVGGYISNETKKFVPTAMGIARHIFPKPYFQESDTVGGIEVRLNIALKRTVQVRLDHPQQYFGSLAGSLALRTWLDLGSDGLVRLPSIDYAALAGSTAVSDDVALAYQPVTLPKALTDSTYTYYAHALYGESTEIGPVSLTIHDGVVQPGDANARVRKPDGTATDNALGVDEELAGVVAGADGKVLVLGKSGGLWGGTPTEPLLFWLPPVFDVYAQPVQMAGLAGVPHNATMVGAGGLIRHLANGKVTEEPTGTKANLTDVCVGEGYRVAVGEKGTLLVELGAGWQTVTVPDVAGKTLRAVACTPFGALAVGDEGWAVTLEVGAQIKATAAKIAAVAIHAAVFRDGKVWLAGDKPAGDGPLLLTGTGLGAWTSGWPAGTVTPTYLPLRALVELPDNAMLLVDREGGVFRLDAKSVTKESSERLDLRIRAGAALPDGTAYLVGQPGLWLGPFLTVPQIDKPSPNAGLSGAVAVEWSVAPGPMPSFSRIHLDGNLDPKAGWGFPFWWIYAGPEISDFKLPDFEEKGIEVFMNNPQVQYWARIDRGYVPGFSINGFSTLDLEFGRWRSRATNTIKLGPK